MSLRLGDIAPNFQAKTSLGEIDFYEYLGDSWGILFSHPADYTPVCTTELGRTAALKDEFAKRNVKVLALSVDPVDKHLGWINDINETQNCTVDFPIVADDDRKISELYDFIHPNANYSVSTPANWQQGENVIVVPAVSTEDAIKKFPKGVEIVKPYLRYTPQPNID